MPWFFATVPCNGAMFAVIDFDVILATSSAALLNFVEATADNHWPVTFVLAANHISLFSAAVDFTELPWTKRVKHNLRWVLETVVPISAVLNCNY